MFLKLGINSSIARVARQVLIPPLPLYGTLRQIMSATPTTATVGETNLNKLLTSMNPELDPEVYVFCSVPVLPFNVSELQPCLIFQELEGVTLIVTQQQAHEHSIDFNYPCRRIVLNVHSSLEAVGFLARITAQLASRRNGREPISVNAVSAYHHDHLFVPEDRADDAMEVLFQLIKDSAKEA